MRKTLHILPLALAATAHAATLAFRDRDARRLVANSGHTMAAIDRIIDDLCILLENGALPHRAIQARLEARGYNCLAGRLAIKVAWERGTIACGTAATVWNREARTFALTHDAYPSLDLSLPRSQAVTALVSAYFDRYGPATIRDAAWWSGLSSSDITAALMASGRPMVTVVARWSGDPCLMFVDRAEENTSYDAITTGVLFLAHEDTALKAYYQTRSRYLGNLPQRCAFNQIGEALPTIIIDGTIAGTWSWNTRTATVHTDLVPDMVTPVLRSQVKARAAVLTETLRAAWAPSAAWRRTLGSHAAHIAQ